MSAETKSQSSDIESDEHACPSCEKSFDTETGQTTFSDWEVSGS